jgi:ABC-type nitrate/sulfonate/bicarbonate transport system ATPase subunit
MEVEIEDVAKSFRLPGSTRDLQVLAPIALQVASGTFLAIIGPSGCGKSTLLKILAGFERPTSGKAVIGGNPVVGPTPTVGMVFQEYALLPWKTVYENMELGLIYRGMPKEQREPMVARYVERVGLQGFEKHYPHELSGGMKQRCALARTFVCDPAVLLMDEPFGALDAQTRELLQEQLLEIWGESQRERKTVLFVTHSIDEALVLSDKIVVMSARPGKILSAYENPLPRPRSAHVRSNPEFSRIREHLWSSIKKESVRAIAQGF